MKKVSRRDVIKVGAATIAAAPFASARAQSWPTRPIKIVVSAAPGGLTNAFARVYGEYISTKLGQTVIVENKPGGSGIPAAQYVKSADPDGNTLLYTNSSTLLGNRVVFKTLPYDPDKDFAFISMTPSGHLPLIVHASTGATTLKEFIDYARNNKITAGSYGTGSFAHIVAIQLKQEFGLDLEVAQYRGEAPMWHDFLSGSIQLATGSYQAAVPAFETGKGRAIAVPSPVRMKKLPDVPTFLEQGYTAKVFQAVGWTGLLGPADMPQGRVELLSRLMVEAGSGEAVQKMLDTFAIDEAAQDRTTFLKVYKTEGPIWIDAVKQLGIDPV
ncbi:tripartite tricarboxylate transporter substrate binding protein [Bradyrhizobium sp. OAE829]|uniref:Bug family tripartite tricarboxylate transporter substrate binding protein n=1 Tax=Bradyrhizobium sp. OAE829 TaxID=2663807 RepID=UPI00178B74F7